MSLKDGLRGETDIGAGTSDFTGHILQHGNAGMDSAGSVWVAYPTPFDSTPNVVATPEAGILAAGSEQLSVDTVTTGSFLISHGVAGTEGSFFWLAAGDGGF